jgi:hypothetical protein
MTVRSLYLNQHLEKLINILSVLAPIKLAALVLLAQVINSSLFSFVFFPEDNSGPHFESIIERIILVIVIAPIVETYIFHYWLIKKILKHSSNNKILSLAVSSLIFGLGHHYSIAYILNATIAGIFYALMFFAITENKRNPYFYIAATHASFNFIGFLIT